MQWLVVLPLEIIAASITIQFWNHGTVNSAAWVILFLLLIICINFFGVRGYGEAEFVFAIIKVIAIIGFIILGIVLAAGGGPKGGYIGGMYWVGEPGAFHNGSRAFAACLSRPLLLLPGLSSSDLRPLRQPTLGSHFQLPSNRSSGALLSFTSSP